MKDSHAIAPLSKNMPVGADTLTGGADDDILFCGKGDDIILGGAGSATLFGGSGGDIFAWAAEDFEGNDTIVDFQYGGEEGDRLYFEDLFPTDDGVTADDIKALLIGETPALTVNAPDTNILSLMVQGEGGSATVNINNADLVADYNKASGETEQAEVLMRILTDSM